MSEDFLMSMLKKFFFFFCNFIFSIVFRLDFLFDDDDIESYGSYFTDEDDFRLADEHDLTDNDEEYRSWH
jgi:hypothetical protein